MAIAERRLVPVGRGCRPPHPADDERRAQGRVRRDLQRTLDHLTPLEPYWAYPGSPQFARVQRLFSAGSYDKFAHAVTRINRALTTESFRTGDVEHAGLDEHDMFGTDPRQLEHQPVAQRDKPYFEVLVVESMTEAQERALRKEVRSWRRPDD